MKFNLRRCNLVDPAGEFVTFYAKNVTAAECAAAILGQMKRLEGGDGQGLTLVHFSAELEAFLTQNTP